MEKINKRACASTVTTFRHIQREMQTFKLKLIF